jgi:hypothetical protein
MSGRLSLPPVRSQHRHPKGRKGLRMADQAAASIAHAICCLDRVPPRGFGRGAQAILDNAETGSAAPDIRAPRRRALRAISGVRFSHQQTCAGTVLIDPSARGRRAPLAHGWGPSW